VSWRSLDGSLRSLLRNKVRWEGKRLRIILVKLILLDCISLDIGFQQWINYQLLLMGSKINFDPFPGENIDYSKSCGTKYPVKLPVKLKNNNNISYSSEKEKTNNLKSRLKPMKRSKSTANIQQYNISVKTEKCKTQTTLTHLHK
jgi:hypothetical protein